jgi:hypothetical protein
MWVVVNSTPRPLYPYERKPPRPVRTGARNLVPKAIRSPDRPTSNKSRLSMPTEIIFPQHQATAASFHILSNSLFIITIRTDVTQSAVEYTFNSTTPYTCRPVDMFALSDICHVQTVLTPFMMAKYYHPAHFNFRVERNVRSKLAYQKQFRPMFREDSPTLSTGSPPADSVGGA